MKFSIKDFFCKYDQIRKKLRIWSHLLKKSLMENFIFLCNERGVKIAERRLELAGWENVKERAEISWKMVKMKDRKTLKH